MPPCSSIHREVRNTEIISRHFGINKTSCCHQSTPEGITRLVSSFTSPHRMSLKFTVSITVHWFMFVTWEYQMLPLVLQFRSLDSSSESFLFCFYSWSNHVFLPRPTPPTSSSFNSTITQHSTISARASADRIRVTWAPPDCNQSENNESKTKSSNITLVGLTFLFVSLVGVFFFLCSFSICFSLLKAKRKTNKKNWEKRRPVADE